MQPYSRPTITRRLGSILGRLHWGPIPRQALGGCWGRYEPVLEKAPELEMKLDGAAIPSTVSRIVDTALGQWPSLDANILTVAMSSCEAEYTEQFFEL